MGNRISSQPAKLTAIVLLTLGLALTIATGAAAQDRTSNGGIWETRAVEDGLLLWPHVVAEVTTAGALATSAVGL